ncbi:MAG: pilus assembly protein PilP [Rudaea sp.]
MSKILLLIALAALTGCTGGDADLREWVAREKAQAGGPIPPLPVLKTFESFEYRDQAMRDPFSPSAEEQNVAQAVSPDPHPKEKLEDYPLDSLKMVGTVGNGPAFQGLVRDPEGTVSRVHVHNYVGQNNGRITAISENRIELVELIPNGNGGWMERQATIELGAK